MTHNNYIHLINIWLIYQVYLSIMGLESII